MEIQLREKVRLKNLGKVGTITGWERKIDDSGHLIERYTVRLEEPVHHWYPCSIVGETFQGYREVKVPESEIQRMRLDSNEDYLDAMRYAMYNAFKIPKEQLNPSKPTLGIDTSKGSITIQLPDAPGHRWFSIRDEHGVRTHTPIVTKSPICECGKEKHGFASHSDWCEKKDNK